MSTETKTIITTQKKEEDSGIFDVENINHEELEEKATHWLQEYADNNDIKSFSYVLLRILDHDPYLGIKLLHLFERFLNESDNRSQLVQIFLTGSNFVFKHLSKVSFSDSAYAELESKFSFSRRDLTLLKSIFNYQQKQTNDGKYNRIDAGLPESSTAREDLHQSVIYRIREIDNYYTRFIAKMDSQPTASIPENSGVEGSVPQLVENAYNQFNEFLELLTTRIQKMKAKWRKAEDYLSLQEQGKLDALIQSGEVMPYQVRDLKTYSDSDKRVAVSVMEQRLRLRLQMLRDKITVVVADLNESTKIKKIVDEETGRSEYFLQEASEQQHPPSRISSDIELQTFDEITLPAFNADSIILHDYYRGKPVFIRGFGKEGKEESYIYIDGQQFLITGYDISYIDIISNHTVCAVTKSGITLIFHKGVKTEVETRSFYKIKDDLKRNQLGYFIFPNGELHLLLDGELQYVLTIDLDEDLKDWQRALTVKTFYADGYAFMCQEKSNGETAITCINTKTRITESYLAKFSTEGEVHSFHTIDGELFVLVVNNGQFSLYSLANTIKPIIVGHQARKVHSFSVDEFGVVRDRLVITKGSEYFTIVSGKPVPVSNVYDIQIGEEKFNLDQLRKDIEAELGLDPSIPAKFHFPSDGGVYGERVFSTNGNMCCVVETDDLNFIVFYRGGVLKALQSKQKILFAATTPAGDFLTIDGSSREYLFREDDTKKFRTLASYQGRFGKAFIFLGFKEGRPLALKYGDGIYHGNKRIPIGDYEDLPAKLRSKYIYGYFSGLELSIPWKNYGQGTAFFPSVEDDRVFLEILNSDDPVLASEGESEISTDLLLEVLNKIEAILAVDSWFDFTVGTSSATDVEPTTGSRLIIDKDFIDLIKAIAKKANHNPKIVPASDQDMQLFNHVLQEDPSMILDYNAPSLYDYDQQLLLELLLQSLLPTMEKTSSLSDMWKGVFERFGSQKRRKRDNLFSRERGGKLDFYSDTLEFEHFGSRGEVFAEIKNPSSPYLLDAAYSLRSGGGLRPVTIDESTLAIDSSKKSSAYEVFLVGVDKEVTLLVHDDALIDENTIVYVDEDGRETPAPYYRKNGEVLVKVQEGAVAVRYKDRKVKRVISPFSWEDYATLAVALRENESEIYEALTSQTDIQLPPLMLSDLEKMKKLASSPLELLFMLEEYVRDSGIYDFHNAEVIHKREYSHVEQNYAVMMQRAVEIKIRASKRNSLQWIQAAMTGRSEQTYVGKFVAGMCSDANALLLALVRKAGFLAGVNSLLSVNLDSQSQTGKVMNGSGHLNVFVFLPAFSEPGYVQVHLDGTFTTTYGKGKIIPRRETLRNRLDHQEVSLNEGEYQFSGALWQENAGVPHGDDLEQSQQIITGQLTVDESDDTAHNEEDKIDLDPESFSIQERNTISQQIKSGELQKKAIQELDNLQLIKIISVILNNHVSSEQLFHLKNIVLGIEFWSEEVDFSQLASSIKVGKKPITSELGNTDEVRAKVMKVIQKLGVDKLRSLVSALISIAQ